MDLSLDEVIEKSRKGGNARTQQAKKAGTGGTGASGPSKAKVEKLRPSGPPVNGREGWVPCF